MSERQQRLRLTAALATSVVLHAAALAILLWTTPLAQLFIAPPETPEVKLIQVSLLSRRGGGGGGPLPGPPALPLGHGGDDGARPPLPGLRAALTPQPPPLPAPVEKQHPPVATPSASAVASLRALAPPPQPPAPARGGVRAAPTPAVPVGDAPHASPSGHAGSPVATLGSGSGSEGGGGGSGTGDGSGGDGSDGLARPAYGSNPKPPYPLAARRLGVEGVVLLDVLVRPDGSPAEVRVRTSSGSSLLDDSAVETVRAHWRFIPARRGNVPVESRVSFPIRFKLDAG